MVLLRFLSRYIPAVFLSLSIAFSQAAVPPVAGDGTSGNPYQIASLNNLYWITQTSAAWNKHYLQTADIDASSTSGWDSGNGFLPIGSNSTSFTGSYDGGGFTISGLTISRSSTDYVGLFGYISDATIKNITLTGINITGNSAVGGVVGYSTGSGSSVIQKCSAAGTLTGTASQLGGVIGKTQAGTNITECFANVTVSTTNGNYLGGFVGHNDQSSVISNCYSRGNVTTTNGNQAGGFCGVNQSSTLTNCYSVGVPSAAGSFVGGLIGAAASSTVNNSFWDTEASGKGTSAGGTGKTTAQMKTQSTFTDAGWDFSAKWEMIGSNYPRLQTNPDQSLPVELVSFSVTADRRNAEIKWKTAGERNNIGFELERKEIRCSGVEEYDQTTNAKSQNSNRNWVKIGFVEGNGNTSAPHEYSFTDHSLKAGKYSFRLKQIDRDGKFAYSQEVEVTVGSVPKIFALEQNYPNPFNPATTIGFTLQSSGPVTLKIYDAIGREVATVLNDVMEAGVYYQRQFHAGDLSSGVYIVRLTSGSQSQSKKLTLLK